MDIVIVKSENRGTWFVIDALWGIHVKHSDSTRKACIQWCENAGIEYRIPNAVW